MKHSDTHGFWYGFNITALILSVFFVLGLPLLFALAQYEKTVDIKAQSAETAEVLIPSTFTIDIQNETGTLLNAIEFELGYDPKALQIISIVPHDTLCEDRFIISNSINNASGTALFQCGTVTPFSKAAGTVATVHVLPLVSGTSSITFGELTHVLVHDGLGTDATRERQELTFTAI